MKPLTPEAERRKYFREMLVNDHDLLVDSVENLVAGNFDERIDPMRQSQIREWLTKPKTKNLAGKLVITLGVYVFHMQPTEVTSIFKSLPPQEQDKLNERVEAAARSQL